MYQAKYFHKQPVEHEMKIKTFQRSLNHYNNVYITQYTPVIAIGPKHYFTFTKSHIYLKVNEFSNSA